MKANVFLIFFGGMVLVSSGVTATFGEEWTDYNVHDPGVTLDQAIPDWVKNQFDWYLKGEIDEKTLLTSMNWMFDNNIMHLSENAAQEVQEMRNEIVHLKQELEETKAAIPNLLEARKSANESSATTTGERIMQPEFGAGDGAADTAISPTISSIAAVDVPSLSGVPFKVFVVGGTPSDINALIQDALRESNMETSEDLQYYADKVRYYNDLKDAIRDENQRSQELLAHELTHSVQQNKNSTWSNELYWIDITLPDGSLYSCSSLPKTESDSRDTYKADLEECQDVQESIPKCIQNCNEIYSYNLLFCAGLVGVEAQQGCQMGAIEAKRFCEQKCHESPPP